MSEKATIRWKAREYHFRKKSADWYWILWGGTLLISAVVYYFFDDPIFATLIVFLGLLFTLIGNKRPKIRKYAVNEKGIYLADGKEFISFDELSSYNILHEEGKIIFDFKKKFKPIVELPFEKSQSVKKLDEFLSSKLSKNEDLFIPLPEYLLKKFLGI